MKKILKLIATALAAAITLSAFAFSAEAAGKPKYYIKAMFENVNVRKGPGTKYKKVGKAKLGEKYECLASAIDSAGMTWYRIKCNVPEAWISGDYSRRYQFTIKGDAEPANTDSSGSAYNAAFQELINETAEKYGADAMQIAVIRGSDGQLFNWNYGYATKNTEPMTTDAKLRLASITKVFVAMCAYKMQEEGIVDVNKNIEKYWDGDFPVKVTLKHLMTHTSPLRYLSFKPTAKEIKEQLEDEYNYLSKKSGKKSQWMYNNYASGVAGSTLELASGKTLEAYAHKKFFDPLGIDATFYSGTFGSSVSIATLYEADGAVERSIPEARSVKGSKAGNNTNAFAGGLTCSAKDAAKLFSILANDGKYQDTQLLSAESVEQMEERLFTTKENGGKFYQCVPLRYAAKRYGTNGLYYHTGNAYGAISMMSYDPETKDTVVVITVGADPKRDKYGVYEVCSSLTKKLYKNMENLGT